MLHVIPAPSSAKLLLLRIPRRPAQWESSLARPDGAKAAQKLGCQAPGPAPLFADIVPRSKMPYEAPSSFPPSENKAADVGSRLWSFNMFSFMA